MSKILGMLVILLATWSIPSYASLIFDFSFTTQRGNLPGTVTGRILGLVDNQANQAATAVFIDSYPDTFPSGTFSALSEGNDAALWSDVMLNSFDVFGGQLTKYGFVSNALGDMNLLAITSSGGTSSAYGAGYYFLSFRQNHTPEPYLLVAASDARFDIFAREILSPVPEPGTYAMVLAGLGLLGFMRRKKKVEAFA